ncbi:MAG: methyltransferase family protein [Promethearchaeota archaeon]
MGYNVPSEIKRKVYILTLNSSLYFIFIPVFSFVFAIQLENYFFHIWRPPNYISEIIGLILIFFGLILFFSALVQLKKYGKGMYDYINLVNTSEIVDKGLYRFCRHPMALAYIIFLIGIGIIFNTLSYFLFVFIPIIIIIFLYLKFVEEKNLIEKFNKSYKDYSENVGFILPKFQ